VFAPFITMMIEPGKPIDLAIIPPEQLAKMADLQKEAKHREALD